MTVNTAMQGRDQKRIAISRFAAADMKRNVWFITTTEGTPLSTVIDDPTYWIEVQSRLRVGDRIEVATDDGAYWAELRVVKLGDRTARVSVIFRSDELPTAKTDPLPRIADGFEVKWKGPQLKWAVLAKDSPAPLQSGFDNKEDAGKWLEQHTKALAA